MLYKYIISIFVSDINKLIRVNTAVVSVYMEHSI